MPERMVYHWKHGWIPLTHAAALSKAKGNAKLADKYVPGTSTHHASRPTAGVSARSLHGGLEPHTHTPAADVSKLKPGDQATVKGMDQYGHDITFTGTVASAPTPVRIKHGAGGAVEHHYAVQMHNGTPKGGGVDATAIGAVYVKRDDVAPESAPTRTPSPGAAPPTAVSALFSRARMTPQQEREHVRAVDQNLKAGRAATSADRATADAQGITDQHRRMTDAELEVAARRSPIPDFKRSAAAEIARRKVLFDAAPTPPSRPRRLAVGDRVKSEYGPGVVTEHTDRSVTYRLDNGETLNVQVGTPGYDRLTKVDAGQEAQAAHLRGAAVAHGNAKPQPTAAEMSRAAATWKSLHPGKPVAGNEAEIGRIADRIAEQRYVDGRPGATPGEAASERARIVGSMRHDEVAKSETVARLAAEARGGDKPRIEHSGDGTLVHNTSRSDTGTNDALKAAGFKWSRNLDAWYLPRTWSESTRRQRVEQVQRKLGDKVQIDDKGYGATQSAAEREAETRSRAADRAVRMDARAQMRATEADVRFGRAKQIGDLIPMGQPILVGHHSERRHRKDLERIHTNMQKGFDAQQASEAAASSAENARRTAAGASPLARQRRVDTNEAEIRKIDRKLKDHESAVKIAATEKYQTARWEVRAVVDRARMENVDRERLAARRAELADQVAHDKAQMEASGHTAIKVADIAPGDIVHYRGRAHIVAKVNKTTVATPTGYSWDDKIPVNQIQRHTKLSTQSDAALETAAKQATDPRVRAAFIRELNRRGIHFRDVV